MQHMLYIQYIIIKYNIATKLMHNYVYCRVSLLYACAMHVLHNTIIETHAVMQKST